MNLTINQARHEIAIAAKASTLFTTGGYSFRQNISNGDLFDVCNPAMRANPALPAYTVNVAAETCDCDGFKGFGQCSHLVAVIEEARLIELVADYEEGETFGPGDVVLAYLKNRPADVCETCGTPALWDDAPDAACSTCEQRALDFVC